MKKLLKKCLLSFLLIFAMIVAPLTASAETIKNDSIVTSKGVQITNKLNEQLKKADPETLINVYVWMVDIDYEAIKQKTGESFFVDGKTLDTSTDEEVQLYIETCRYNLSKSYTVANLEKIENIEKICGKYKRIFVSSYAPFMIASFTKEQIMKLSLLSDYVEVLDWFENVEAVNDSDIANYNSGATALRDSLGYTGSGIKIGMIELGNPLALTEYNALFNVSKIHLVSSFNSNTYSNNLHATRVAAIMVGKETVYNGITYKGIVPDAELYCVQALNTTQMFENIDTLINYGVNVINMSMSVGFQTEYNLMNLWFDHIAWVHDIHFVKTAGNDDSHRNIGAPGLSYNVVTVGSFDDNNYTYNYNGPTVLSEQTLDSRMFNISDYSCYVEGSSATGKPDLIASGTGIVYANLPNEILIDGEYKPINSGTSFAAPQVTGVMVQLMQTKSELRYKQDQMKAILCASAIYRMQDSFEEGGINDRNEGCFFEKQGAGILNGWLARYIAASGKSRSFSLQGNTSTTYTYYMTATTSDIYLRFALTWLKQSMDTPMPGSPSGVTSTSDLANYNLIVTAPNGLVAYSENVRSNIELVQLNTSEYGYGTYTVTVILNESNNLTNYLGLAWY